MLYCQRLLSLILSNVAIILLAASLSAVDNFLFTAILLSITLPVNSLCGNPILFYLVVLIQSLKNSSYEQINTFASSHNPDGYLIVGCIMR